VSALKPWLLGIHAGAVQPKYLHVCLDEFVFRYNRRNTKGVSRIAARTIASLVATAPIAMRQVVENTLPCRNLQPVLARQIFVAMMGLGICVACESRPQQSLQRWFDARRAIEGLPPVRKSQFCPATLDSTRARLWGAGVDAQCHA